MSYKLQTKIHNLTDRAYSFIKKNKIISATDLLVDVFDSALEINDLDLVKDLLDELDCKKLPSEVITAILCITLPAKVKLGLIRENFFERAIVSLINESGFTEEQVNAITFRLR